MSDAYLDLYDTGIGSLLLAAFVGLSMSYLALKAAMPLWILGAASWLALAWAAIATMQVAIDPILPLLDGTLALGIGLAIRHRILEQLQRYTSWLKAQADAMSEELHHASLVSSLLLPERAPDWPELGVAAYHKPLSLTSGDWFAFESSRDGRLRHFVHCDITGHGVQAGIIAATCRTVLNMLLVDRPEAFDEVHFGETMLRTLTKALYTNGRGRHTSTLMVATFDIAAERVYLLAAGHPRPVLLTRDGDTLAPSFPLTVNDLPGARETLGRVKIAEARFRPGDHLISFSDGVPSLGMRRHIKAFLASGAVLAPEAIARYVIEAESATESADLLEDDVSVVWFSARAAASDRVEKSTNIPA